MNKIFRSKLLFVCSMARLRSKTAYTLYGGDYAGTSKDSDKPLTKDLLDEADIIYCMETSHRSKIRRKYKGYSHKIKVLHIPDNYDYMDSELITRLGEKLGYAKY